MHESKMKHTHYLVKHIHSLDALEVVLTFFSVPSHKFLKPAAVLPPVTKQLYQLNV